MSRAIDSAYDLDVETLIAVIESNELYNRGHAEKVTKYALDIASAMHLPPEERWLLAYSGKLHDIGKLAISSSVLNKKDALTAEEWNEIKMHPVKGVDMLSNFMFMEGCIPIIRHHHERYDGKGYPDGLRGEDIPLLARILACADAFVAMTSERIYKSKKNLKDAIQELKFNKGKQFDPDIADVFIDLLSADKK